jgi:hypothetical protein
VIGATHDTTVAAGSHTIALEARELNSSSLVKTSAWISVMAVRLT